MAFYKKRKNTRRHGKKTKNTHVDKQMFEALEGRILLSATPVDEQLLEDSGPEPTVYEQWPATHSQEPGAEAQAAASALEITTPSILPQAAVGEQYSVFLQASGGVAPYTWSFPDAVQGDDYLEDTQATTSPGLGVGQNWRVMMCRIR